MRANHDGLVKSHFSLPWREGIKGRGEITFRNTALITLTLNLPRQGGGDFGLFTRSSIMTSSKSVPAFLYANKYKFALSLNLWTNTPYKSPFFSSPIFGFSAIFLTSRSKASFSALDIFFTFFSNNLDW